MIGSPVVERSPRTAMAEQAAERAGMRTRPSTLAIKASRPLKK